MRQTIVWIGNGIIGIITSMIVGSCGDPTNTGVCSQLGFKYVFINDTDHTISTEGKFFIKPKDSLVFIAKGPCFGIKTGPTQKQLPTEILSDKVFFDGVRCSEKLYEWNEPADETIRRGYYDINNYRHGRVENSTYYEFTYHFTEQDYAASTPCDLNVLEVVVANETDSKVGLRGPWIDIDSNAAKTFRQRYERRGAAFSLPEGEMLDPMSDDRERYRYLYEDAAGERALILLAFRKKTEKDWWRVTSNDRLSGENGQRCILFPAGAGPLLENLDDPKVFEKVVLSDRHVRYTYRVTKAIEAQAIPCGEVKY